MFDPPHWNQVNIDHPDKNQVNFDAHTKTKRFAARIQKPSPSRPPTQETKSIDLHTKNKLISARTVIFDLHT